MSADPRILPSIHPLEITSLTFDYRLQGDPLQFVVKRFSLAQSTTITPRSLDAFTLVFVTGIGSSSEVWIPTIKRLYKLQSEKPHSTVRIANIWTVDAQNQGDSAVLNDHVLKEKFANHDKVMYQYSLAIRRFLSSGLVDSRGSKLVGIGHSGGCGTFALAIPETEPIPYHALILVEPGLWHRSAGASISEDLARRNRPLLLQRTDVWPTRDDAITWMSSRRPWKTWHPEVLQAMSNFGLRDLPTAEHPTETGVTTKQYKGQEVLAFFCTQDNFKSVDMLGRFCSSIPVHVIWGERKDFLPKKMQDILTDPQERPMASISVVPKAGHWVVMEKPDEVSQLVFKILAALDPNPAGTAKL